MERQGTMDEGAALPRTVRYAADDLCRAWGPVSGFAQDAELVALHRADVEATVVGMGMDAATAAAFRAACGVRP